MNLPNEILATIVDYASDPHDLRSLGLTCRTMNALSTPKLYEQVFISAEKGLPQPEALQRVTEGLARARQLVGFRGVHELCIATRPPSSLDEPSHCFHQQQSNSIDDFEIAFKGMSEQMADGCLKSFRWESRCCVPAQVLGSNGYLPQQQRRLSKLSLITSSLCDTSVQGECQPDLSRFTTLRDLSWIGIHSTSDFDALKTCLNANAAHLERLELDVIDWRRVQMAVRHQGALVFRRNPFAEIVLNWVTGRDVPGVILRSLQILSLSNFSFTRGEPQLARAFNLSHLRRLKLNNCVGVPDVLRILQSLNGELRLKQLELTTAAVDDAQRSFETALRDFLLSFHGLEDVFLCVPDLMWEGLAPGVQNHIGSLKRLVIHPTRIDARRIHQNRSVGEDADLDWFGWSVLRLMWTDTHWDFFGTSSSPQAFRNTLEATKSRPDWLVLHLRRSGCATERELSKRKAAVESDRLSAWRRRLEDEEMIEASELGSGKTRVVPVDLVELRFELLEFVMWAFGPDGLPKLQIIAFGDFSERGRYTQFNSLFRRDKTELFYEITKKDARGWPLIEGHWDALESCATQSISK